MSPIALKIFCKVLLNRIEPVLDGVLREEQASFRKGRGCNDQIFVVRHLMQQANEMKASLSLCVVDFEKAFDSVSREAMGKDGVLREEQVGFRKGQGCNDQIFVVRHLMQQANEMRLV